MQSPGTAPVVPAVVYLGDEDEVMRMMCEWYREVVTQRARLSALTDQVVRMAQTQTSTVYIQVPSIDHVEELLEEMKKEQNRPLPHIPRPPRSISL